MLQIPLNPSVEKLEQRLLKFQRKRKQKAAESKRKLLKKARAGKARKRKPASEKVKKKSRRPVKFVDTKLGRLLLIHAPFEYQLVCEAVDPDHKHIRNTENVIKVIEAIANASDNPIFRSSDFRLALIDYRIYGKFTRLRVRWSVKQAVTASQSQQEQIKLQDV